MTDIQVKIVNSIRSKYIGLREEIGLNQKIRNLFKAAIECLKPERVLEVGPGINPLFYSSTSMLVSLADFSEEIIEYHRERKVEITLFGKCDDLPFADNHFSLAYAIFVFQFDISTHQLRELNRVISENGFLIVNIYKRDSISKEILENRFRQVGFEIFKLADENKHVQGNEFWISYKAEPNNLEALIDLFSNTRV